MFFMTKRGKIMKNIFIQAQNAAKELIEKAEGAFDFSEMIDRAVESVKYEFVD